MLKTVYKHERLTELLRSEIQKKEFPAHRFYTAKYLMEHYKISQSTLASALQPLYDEGLLYAVSGKGTYVAKHSEPVISAGARLRNLFCVFSDTEMFSRNANPTDWFVLRDIIAGIADAGQGRGLKVNMSPMPPDIQQFKNMAEQPGNGFIFTRYDLYEQLIEYCIRESIPYAVYSVHQRILRQINQLWVDTGAALRKTTQHLIARGHRKIAFIGDGEDSQRHCGYKQALRQAKISYSSELNMFCSGRIEDSTALAEVFLTAHPEVTAVVCSSDLRGLGVVMAAKKLGRRIPEFGVTGIDNISEIFSGLPRLTTADLMRHRVGEELVRMAMAMADGHAAETLELEAELVIGETT